MSEALQPVRNQSPSSPRFRWHDASISEIIDIAPDVKLFRFQFAEQAEGGVPFDFKSGQWVALRLPAEGDGRPVTRAYSISNPPQERQYLEICVKEVTHGKLTPWLFARDVGDPVQVRTPQGRFVLREDLPGPMAFAATGTGVAPFWCMINDLVARGTQRRLDLIFGARHEADILYRRGFEELQQRFPDLRITVTLSRPDADWQGARGYVQSHLARLFPNPGDRHLYVCGLREMVDEVRAAARSIGWDEERLFVEKYD